jgi:predicted esterase
MKFAALALAVFSLAGAGGAAAQDEAWNAGTIFVPASLSLTGEGCASRIGGKKCIDRIAEGRHPVILFMHGCNGVRRPKAFLNLGAIVVEPNSFWQGERCTLNVAEMAKLLSSRVNDLADAVRQLKAAHWADPARLVLAGYSQGGVAAALYEGPEFKARVVIAWPCQLRPTGPSGPETGVRGNGPVLAIQSRNDRLYERLGIEGDCGPEISDRPGSRSVLIPGNAHEIMDHPTTREAISAFVPEVIR